MRVVFMGTPDFAVPCLRRLIEDGHEVLAVYSQPDKPKGRGYQLAPTPVKEAALEHGIEVRQPTKMRDGAVAAELQALAPDLVVVVAYGRILPPDILAAPKLGCINIHGSLLPKYRGAAPIQWSVLNGDEYAGVTSMYMAEGMDTGDMILKLETKIGENETSGELFERLAPLGAECLSQTMKLFESGNVPREVQNETDATMAPMLDKAMGKIDFTKPAQQLHNLIRGLNPWPSAYLTAPNGKLLKLHASCVVEGSGKAGEILDSKKLVVACGTKALQLITVQPEGKSKMSGDDYMRGARLQKGDILG